MENSLTNKCLVSLFKRCVFFSKRKENAHTYDVVVIGGGIVGAATAREVQNRHPGLRCAIVEKEDGFGGCYHFFFLPIMHIQISIFYTFAAQRYMLSLKTVSSVA